MQREKGQTTTVKVCPIRLGTHQCERKLLHTGMHNNHKVGPGQQTRLTEHWNGSPND